MKKLFTPILHFSLLGFLLFGCSKKRVEANYQTIPLAQSIELQEQNEPFELTSSVKIFYDTTYPEMKNNAEFLASYIQEKAGYTPTIEELSPQADTSNSIVLKSNSSIENPEGYCIEIDNKQIRITGATSAGVFYGIQTLRKSLPAHLSKNQVFLPSVVITDAPRFAYRGAHFDVSRHFFTVDEVKTYIDMMALHQMNRLHLHLTDDQGWRLEIKKYPKLTEIGSVREGTVIGRNSGEYDNTPHGGYYTQDQAREIVAYAARQFITIIPEVDLPGHMQAALAAYPHLGCTGESYKVWQQWGVSDDVLCAGNDSTLTFLKDVYSEVIDIFPSTYVHIGGDECPKTRWESCPKCQKRIIQLGLKSDAEHTKEEYLQSFVISYIEKFLNEKGRQIIGWDEILEGGLAPNATVMSWRGEKGGIEAAKQGHDVIMTPNTYLYFDYYQTQNTDNEPLAIGGYVPIDKVYSYEPMPKSLTKEQQKHIIGVQANLWTEYIPTFAQAQYMVLPRWAALSEVQWSQPQTKDYSYFLQRLPQLLAIYDSKQYNYAKHVLDVKMEFSANTENNSIDVSLSSIQSDVPIYCKLNEEKPFLYTQPIELNADTKIEAWTTTLIPNANTRTVEEQTYFNLATTKPIKANQSVNKQYEYNGISTLTDGLKGANNYRTGRWIAFYGNDLDATIDLLKPETVSSVAINTCVEKGDWVFDARSFSVEVSTDGKSFQVVATEEYPPMEQDSPNGVYTHTLTFEPTQAQYIRVIATSEKSIPHWHGGKGNRGFLFVDEIEVK